MGAESVMLTHPVSFSLQCKDTGVLRLAESQFVHLNYTFVQKRLGVYGVAALIEA